MAKVANSYVHLTWLYLQVHTVCDNITLMFRFVFIEQFDRSTVARFTYCVGTVAEFKNSMGYDRSDMGEMTLAFVELWNKHSQTRDTIEFTR